MLPDPKDPVDDVADTETDAADEGADEGAEDESNGTDGDDGEDSEDAADDVSGDAEEGEVEAEEEAPRKRTASDVVRESKKARKAAEAKQAETERKADEALRRAEAAERRAEEAERRANERRETETRAQEEARLELMSESEKAEHYRSKSNAEHRKEIDGLKFQMWDSTDRTEFRQLAKEDPLVAKVKDKVEAKFAELRAKGQIVSRELLANQEIAQMVRSGRVSATKDQKSRAKEAVRRETVKAPRARSDVAPTRSRRGQDDTAEARRKRLEDVQL